MSMIRSKGTWVPVLAFLAAGALAGLTNAKPVRVFLRPQAATTCSVVARVVGITGSATAWNIALTNMKIDSTNNKTAQLRGKTTAALILTVSGKDTKGVAFQFQDMPSVSYFTPDISKDYAAGTRVDQFAPLNLSSAQIWSDAQVSVRNVLATQKRRVKSWDPPVFPVSQNVNVQVNGTFKCKNDDASTVAIGNAMTLTLVTTAAGNAPAAGVGVP